MTIGLFIAFALICVVVDFGVRALLNRLREQRRRRECADALAVSLNLDFTLEAKSLKRVEVKHPAARILCVDDEAIVLDSFRKILVLDGYSVDTVETGQEALGLIKSHHYDFVFTDLRMPAMDGVDVVKSVKHLRPDIDLIIINGYATVETAVECMKHGAMDYVQKPFTEDELRAFVKKAVIKRTDRIETLLKPRIRITNGSGPITTRNGEFSIPGGLLISPGHCWASLSPDGSVKVGLDDFAKKLIGRVDGVELPKEETTLQAGQPLFSVRQGQRRIQFRAPVSGRILKVNQGLATTPGELESTPYHNHWVCKIEGQRLHAEISTLTIGQSAVTLFQDDIERFKALVREPGTPDSSSEPEGAALCIGALERLSDAQWEKVTRTFFDRSA
jgi:CheY-like chemotaxis protein